MIELSNDMEKRILRVRNFDSETFSDLVRVAELDPRKDFEYANLQGVDFTGSDLRGFNFNYADLRGAIWDRDLTMAPEQYEFALRGRNLGPASPKDYDDLSKIALKSKTWAERFYAFAFAVDCFGEVRITYHLLKQIIDNDNSTYMVNASVLYFLSSRIHHLEAMDYCLTMASNTNSFMNQFRFRKLSRLKREISSYIESITGLQNYPGQIEITTIWNLLQHEPLK